MLERRGDLFAQEADAVCLTTNGTVDRAGRAVMGRGCARQAARRWPDLPSVLGTLLRTHGNHMHLLTARSGNRLTVAEVEVPYHLVAFPVKPAAAIFDGRNVVRHLRLRLAIGQSVPGWACVASPTLIKLSCLELVVLADAQGWRRVLLPRPGCGAGELDWADDVRPLLRDLLDDRFTAMTF